LSLISSQRVLDFGFWIEELEMTEEARHWVHRPTVAFFFKVVSVGFSILDFGFSIEELQNWK
jgi:hypothetical protein